MWSLGEKGRSAGARGGRRKGHSMRHDGGSLALLSWRRAINESNREKPSRAEGGGETGRGGFWGINLHLQPGAKKKGGSLVVPRGALREAGRVTAVNEVV